MFDFQLIICFYFVLKSRRCQREFRDGAKINKVNKLPVVNFFGKSGFGTFDKAMFRLSNEIKLKLSNTCIVCIPT